MNLELLNKLAERRRFGMKPGLDTITALMERLGNPQNELAAIHIAGTNGKGATAAIIDSILRAAGYPVARYTSPHLIKLNERFVINGEPASDASLESAAARVLSVISDYEKERGEECVTFFEALTAVAFLLFRDAGAKLVVLETGLGGRLDATNIVTPLISVLTRIGLDHCDWLGDTLEKIATEKAGIIKPSRPVIIGAMPEEAMEVMTRTAAHCKARAVIASECVNLTSTNRTLSGQTLKVATPSITLPPVKFPLAGSFQLENAITAVAAIEVLNTLVGLPVSEEAIHAGLENVKWPGRFQLVREDPPTIIDGAHNPEGARALLEALKYCKVAKRPIALIAGFCGDKDAISHLRTLAPIVKCSYAVETPNPRSLTADKCAGVMRMAGLDPVEASPSLAAAYSSASAWAASHNGLVLICGSLFLSGAALQFFSSSPISLDPSEKLTPHTSM